MLELLLCQVECTVVLEEQLAQATGKYFDFVRSHLLVVPRGHTLDDKLLACFKRVPLIAIRLVNDPINNNSLIVPRKGTDCEQHLKLVFLIYSRTTHDLLECLLGEKAIQCRGDFLGNSLFERVQKEDLSCYQGESGLALVLCFGQRVADGHIDLDFLFDFNVSF